MVYINLRVYVRVHCSCKLRISAGLMRVDFMICKQKFSILIQVFIKGIDMLCFL
jgi:hypothetical protein